MIGKDAFCNTGLTAINIPANVATIGDGAFENTYKLAEITFASNSKLTIIPSKMFYCSFGNNEIKEIRYGLVRRVYEIYDDKYIQENEMFYIQYLI